MTEDDLRDVFDSVDADKSGDISMEEYFLWTLSIAAEKAGSGLEEMFKRYDSSGEGVLDADEFTRAVEDMGFGSVAHELFLEMDQDEGGSVSYVELIAMIQSRTMSVGRECKRFLTAMAFDRQEQVVALDTATWEIQASTCFELRQQISSFVVSQQFINLLL